MHKNNREKVLFHHRLKTSAKGSKYVTEDAAVHKVCTQEMNLKTLLDFITNLNTYNMKAGYTLKTKQHYKKKKEKKAPAVQYMT